MSRSPRISPGLLYQSEPGNVSCGTAVMACSHARAGQKTVRRPSESENTTLGDLVRRPWCSSRWRARQLTGPRRYGPFTFFLTLVALALNSAGQATGLDLARDPPAPDRGRDRPSDHEHPGPRQRTMSSESRSPT